MNDEKIKHLEMVQTVVTRMATNSFMIKGWSVTLVSALFALAAKDADARYVYVSYFPAAIFWFLDGYFLYQERLFRRLYEKVRLSPVKGADFSMSTKGLDGQDATWASAIFSKTRMIFHGAIIFTICFVMFYLCRK